MHGITGIISFPHPVPVRGDALGRSYNTNINGIAAKIILPSIKLVPTSYPPGEFGEQIPKLFCPEEVEVQKEYDWGEVYTYNVKQPNNTSVMATSIIRAVITIETEENKYEIASEKIASGIDKWREHFYEITNLLGKNTIQSKRSEKANLQGRALGVELFDSDGSLIAIEHEVILSAILHKKENCLSTDELIKVFQTIDVNRKMRIEYSMLSNALYEQRDGKARFAIMEATTAVELCVTQKIYERCKELEIDGEGLCDSFYRSLGNRFDLLKHLGIELATKDPNNEIVNPRNKLFHNRTINPTMEESAKVLKKVKAYLEKYTPDIYE